MQGLMLLYDRHGIWAYCLRVPKMCCHDMEVCTAVVKEILGWGRQYAVSSAGTTRHAWIANGKGGLYYWELSALRAL